MNYCNKIYTKIYKQILCILYIVKTNSFDKVDEICILREKRIKLIHIKQKKVFLNAATVDLRLLNRS